MELKSFYFYCLIFFVLLLVAFATINPTTKPIAMVSGISIIWGIPIFQKKSRKVTGWIFWTSMIRNRTIKANTAINFGLIINLLYQLSLLNRRRGAMWRSERAPLFRIES
ncbi:MAG: hypothetical protein R6T98_01010 [Desulfatiglandales bacterium]